MAHQLTALHSNNDAHVQGTNDDAQLSKASCVKLGYFKDDFIQHFVRRPTKRAPLINRGYYSRYAALRGLLLRFLALPLNSAAQAQGRAGSAAAAPAVAAAAAPAAAAAGDTGQEGSNSAQHNSVEGGEGLAAAAPEAAPAPARSSMRQVLSLGAGFDTAFFQLVKEGRAPDRYVEVDFQQVTSRKAAVIQQTPDLLACLGSPEQIAIDVAGGRVVSPCYCLLPADLRDTAALAAALEGAGFDSGLPTFVLSECVLVYMEPQHSAAVVRWLGATLRCAAMAIYEQIRPGDAFGRQMLHNLEARGCPLKGIWGTPDLEAQRRRFTEGGWGRAEARSMDDIYRCCLEPGDRRRIERLELFDEFEEWDLIQAHYCIGLGVKDTSGLLDGFGFQQYAAAAATRQFIG